MLGSRDTWPMSVEEHVNNVVAKVCEQHIRACLVILATFVHQVTLYTSERAVREYQYLTRSTLAKGSISSFRIP